MQDTCSREHVVQKNLVGLRERRLFFSHKYVTPFEKTRRVHRRVVANGDHKYTRSPIIGEHLILDLLCSFSLWFDLCT